MPKAQRIAAGFLTALLAASLAACSNGGGGGTIATVNGESISRADFDSKLESGPAAKGVLSQMAQSMVLEQEAKDKKIEVAPQEVDKKVNALKAQYGATQLDGLMKQRGMTEDDLRKAITDQIIIDKAVGGNVKIQESDISKFFAKNHAAFDKPGSIHARHILATDLKTAQMIEQKLKAGGKFEDLAKQYSIDPGTKDKGGDLGTFRQGQMVPSFEKAALSQPLNQVGPPVKSPFGYHVIEVLERTPGQKATLATTHDQIADQLRQQQEGPLVQPFLQSLMAKAKIDVKETKFADVFPSPAASAAPAAPAPSGTPVH
ncbi:MAG: peptidylprolyl isomerase [Candidatus Eremiobacteraeota bacterium]|nr:peptidylprolyl isomerase [Candidatus Eremiobacteraeota bacterium]